MKLPPARRWVTAFFLTNCLSSLPAFLVPSERISAFKACLQAGCCLWQSTGMEIFRYLPNFWGIKLFHLSWDRTKQLHFSPLILWHNLSMDMFDAAISCSVRLFQHKPGSSLIVNELLQFQKSFLCYIYKPSHRRGGVQPYHQGKVPPRKSSLLGLDSNSPLPQLSYSRLCSLSLALEIELHRL